MMILQDEIGSIHFNSTPEGAVIYLNGVFQGANTPCIITDVPIGEYTYWLVLDGYIVAIDHIVVVSNQMKEIYVELTPITLPSNDIADSLIGIFKFVILTGGIVGVINLMEEKTYKHDSNIR